MLTITILVVLAKMAACINLEVDEKYKTLPFNEFVEYFNSQNFSWKITNYNQELHLGHYEQTSRSSDIPVECNYNLCDELPKNFDSREKWSQCETIKEIYNQGHCGSCWTFGTGNTASDRTCIHKGIQVHLAEQDFQCLIPNVCDGGNSAEAFLFWQRQGLVSNKCKPYDVQKLLNGTCTNECVDKNISDIDDKHFAERIYQICNEQDAIKTELFNNGPIQAGYMAYEDFIHYHSGIYEHLYGEPLSGHSVRVIGYGVEDNIEYWHAANSWGVGWGENGYFKIKANQEFVNFEDFMFSGIPRN